MCLNVKIVFRPYLFIRIRKIELPKRPIELDHCMIKSSLMDEEGYVYIDDAVELFTVAFPGHIQHGLTWSYMVLF